MYIPEISLLEQWVSEDRLTRYRNAREDTAQLYLWNAELSSAYFEIIGHAEILLRNVFHSRLAPQSRNGQWYLDARYPFTYRARKDIDSARSRATKGSPEEKPGKVIAELSFGFWRYLLSNKYSTTIWPIVAPGFEGVPRHERERARLEAAATRVNKLRNRIAHHEPVFHLSPENNLADIHLIASYVDVRAERLLRELSRVENAQSRRPKDFV